MIAVTADMIRNGSGLWKYDLKTVHPQIKQLQERLNRIAADFASDIGYAYPDGVYGENTRYLVEWYQGGLDEPRLTQDGLFGKETLKKMESFGWRIN